MILQQNGDCGNFVRLSWKFRVESLVKNVGRCASVGKDSSGSAKDQDKKIYWFFLRLKTLLKLLGLKSIEATESVGTCRVSFISTRDHDVLN